MAWQGGWLQNLCPPAGSHQYTIHSTSRNPERRRSPEPLEKDQENENDIHQKEQFVSPEEAEKLSFGS